MIYGVMSKSAQIFDSTNASLCLRMKVDGPKNKALKQFLCVFVAILSVRLTIFLVSTSDQIVKNVDQQETTVIEDNVHGPMRVPSYFLKFINTLEFQRLRNVKQMGITYSVFSGAMHTRFEHCIGTGYLSYTLLETLEKNSGVKIGGLLKKCVAIAGLLHDLGHGPFSHVWEHIIHSGINHTWTHEQSSCDMFVQLVKINNITLWHTEDEHNYSLELIQALIVGDTIKLEQLLPSEMNFLSEIVNNKFCNIDVDKVDYLLRDGYHLKNSLEIKEDFAKFLHGSKIITDSKNVTHIGFRIQDYPLICKMFEYRANIHTKIIQNTKTKGAELMLVDAFLEAEHRGFTFKNQKLSLIQSNAKLFTQFDDTIKKFIEISDDPRLKEAQDLFRRIKLGRFYDVICESAKYIDVNVLNNQFGNHFILKHEKVPQPEVPANIVLFDNRGGVVASRKPYKSLSHESYIIYSKSENTDINRKAKVFMKTSKLIYY